MAAGPGEDLGEAAVAALAAAHMKRLHAGIEAARADAQESDAVAVSRIHVRLDLEDKTGKGLLLWVDLAALGLTWPRGGSKINQRIEKLFDTKVIDRAAKEDRRLFFP